MYSVAVNLPNSAEGAEVEIDALGIFVNGADPTEVSDEDAHNFFVKHNVTLGKAVFQPGVTVSGLPAEDLLPERVVITPENSEGGEN